MNRPIFPLKGCTVTYRENAHDPKKNIDYVKYKVDYPNPGTNEPMSLVVSNKTGNDGLTVGDKADMLVEIGGTSSGGLWILLHSFALVVGASLKK